jgi:predicted AAA+ superfamily ATPase
MKTILSRFNPWWEGEVHWDFVERAKYIQRLQRYLETGEVVLITGLRRVGKTTIIKMLIRHLIDSGIPPGRIFYVSLDFYGLERFSILQIVEEFLKIQRLGFSEGVYLFLDEVAYKEDFSVQLKNLYDTYNARVLASSSSSSVLRDGKAMLTGRERVVEVLPLDFQEYLAFKGITIKDSDLHLLDGYFEDYMQTGGMPEYVLTGDPEYIKQLIDDVVYKEIVAFHGVRERTSVREFFRLLMERSGKQISLNKISKVLGVSVDTARRFLRYFEECYMVYTVERCGKLNERLKSPKKVYAGDVGIRNTVTGFRDRGAVFENLVYLSIKHRRPCYVYKNGVEIDFFTEDGVLMEAKYGQELTDKQKRLIETTKAREKVVVDGVTHYLGLLADRDRGIEGI